MRHTSEKKIYIFSFLQYSYFPKLLVALLSWLLRIVVRQIGRGLTRRLGMPHSVSAIRKKFVSTNPSTYKLNSECPQVSVKLTLVDREILFDHFSIWHTEFSDKEITYSLHRWGWLFPEKHGKMSGITYDQGIKLIKSWLCTMSDDKVQSLDAYSESERIANGCQFFITNGHKTIPKEFQASFRRMAQNIALNLEYYDSGLTGNHVLNNARGLLYAGIYADIPEAVDLGAAIIIDRLPFTVNENGFFIEASSHYHFLITSWMLEILELAILADNIALKHVVKDYLKLLLERCWFLLVYDYDLKQWDYPLIGDVSPDCHPSWLTSLPWCHLSLDVYSPTILPNYTGKCGWSSFRGLKSGYILNHEMKMATTTTSGWHRIDNAELTLFVFGFPSTERLAHCHEDFLSFCLYYRGEPIIVDPGRPIYASEPSSNRSLLAIAHNTVTLDGLPGKPSFKAYFPKQYMDTKISVELSEDEGSKKLTFSHEGFGRLRHNHLKHSRTFEMKGKSLLITDSFEGNGIYNIGLSLNLDSKFSLKRTSVNPGTRFVNLFELQSDRGTFLKIRTSASAVSDKRMISRAYGSRDFGQSIELDIHSTLPNKIEVKLDFA